MSRGIVVVTGASTGIGEATARRLGQLGFDVIAGVRRDEDADRLASDPSGKVRPVRLDVTDPAHVDSLAGVVAQAGAGYLRAIVNNAGIAVIGPVEVLPIADWRRQIEVNLLGQVAVTRALLPALLERPGRVVNVSSIGGLVAGPLFGPYSASKFGMEAFTDVLRRELHEVGVVVIAVEPGAIATPIWERARVAGEQRWTDVDPVVTRRYARHVEAARAMAENGAASGLPPQAVAEVIARAITSRRPRTRYVVGRDAVVQAWANRILPDRVMDAMIRRMTRSPSRTT